jgi:protein AroM
LIPIPEQAEILCEQRSRPGVEVVAEVLNPGAEGTAVAEAAQRLAARKPDLVAMDCMSYTPATKEIVHRWIAAPILLAVTATSRVLRELLD